MKNKFLIVLLLGCMFFIGGCGADDYLDDGLDNQQSNKEYKEYKIGDVITFNKETWHVIKDSNKDEDYVVILKDERLIELDGMPYYECPPERDNGLNCSGWMSDSYEDSVAKEYFDKIYIKSLGENNLKNVDGYAVRLITLDELENLGCNVDLKNCYEGPKWLISSRMIWTMTNNVERQGDVWAYGSLQNSTVYNELDSFGVGSTFNVKPVVNLLKDSIEG